MKTHSTPEIDPLPNDAQSVRKVMSRATIDAFHGGEDTIGVRGPTGAIYRRFVSEGAPEFVGAVDELMKLNLVDELLESGKVAEGCIAIFRVK